MHTKVRINTITFEFLAFFFVVNTTKTPWVYVRLIEETFIFAKYGFLKPTPMQTVWNPKNCDLKVFIWIFLTYRTHYLNTLSNLILVKESFMVAHICFLKKKKSVSVFKFYNLRLGYFTFNSRKRNL